MNKKLNSLLISLLTIFFLIQFFINSETLIKSFYQGLSLWFYHLLPNIFIFFIITDILNNYHFPYYITKIFGNIFEKIYKLPPSSCYIVFMSMMTGFPGNSKLIKEKLEKGQITSNEATRLLTMTHFSNPLFIIYTIGINFFHQKKIGLIILITHFITNFLVGFLFRGIFINTKKNVSNSFNESLSFMTMLKQSINNAINLLLNVLGIIIFFSLLTTVINQYLNLNIYSNTFLNGLLEITKGLNLLSTLPLSTIKKATIATFFISFGGFSVHMQIMSILNNYKINYLIYLISRIIHATISSLIVFLLINC